MKGSKSLCIGLRDFTVQPHPIVERIRFYGSERYTELRDVTPPRRSSNVAVRRNEMAAYLYSECRSKLEVFSGSSPAPHRVSVQIQQFFRTSTPLPQPCSLASWLTASRTEVSVNVGPRVPFSFFLQSHGDQLHLWSSMLRAYSMRLRRSGAHPPRSSVARRSVADARSSLM